MTRRNRDRYREIRRNRATVIRAARKLVDDQTASIAPGLYGTMKYKGALIENGTRINWRGVLVRAAVDLWDLPENNPDSAPTLWERVMYRDGIRIIPEVITAGAAFSEGEIGWWGDILKRSIRPGEKTNVHTPDEAPELWEDYVAEETPEEVVDA